MYMPLVRPRSSLSHSLQLSRCACYYAKPRSGFGIMRNPLIAVLCSYGLVTRCLAFAPPSTAAVRQHQQQRVGGKSSSSSNNRGGSRCFLFSPDHGDHDGPIVASTSTATKKKAAATAAGKKVAREPGGGWGAWEKVVSQRQEQESVLKRLKASSGLRVRTVQKGDMLSISR